jgi:hypothetical protein
LNDRDLNNFVAVDAATKLDRVFYDQDAEYADRAVHFGHYACAGCGQAVRFSTPDFLRGTRYTHPPQVDAEMQKARALRNEEKRLDFRCPSCASPARLIYTQAIQGRGSYCATALAIIERKNGS